MLGYVITICVQGKTIVQRFREIKPYGVLFLAPHTPRVESLGVEGRERRRFGNLLNRPKEKTPL